MSATNREQIITEVMKWIIQSGFQVESVSNSKHDFAIVFCETEALPQLQIIHQNSNTAYLLVVSSVSIPKSDREELRTKGEQLFYEFVYDIKLNLLHMGVDFTVLGPDENDPEAWEVQTRLFINEANTSSFHDACSRVKRALISVIWSHKRALTSVAER